MTEIKTNGQDSENESPTEGKTATPSVESSKDLNLSSENKDVKQNKVVPYTRFSEIVAEKNRAISEAEKAKSELQTLKSLKEAPSVTEINKLTKQIPEKSKAKLERLFGEENLEEGYDLLQEIFEEKLTEALTAKERKLTEESLAKVELEKANLEYVNSETQKVVKEYDIKDINKFHKFIEDFVKEKGGKVVRNEDGNLDFEYYAIRHEREIQKPLIKKANDFEKVSGKTVSKTQTTPTFTVEQVRNW